VQGIRCSLDVKKVLLVRTFFVSESPEMIPGAFVSELGFEGLQ